MTTKRKRPLAPRSRGRLRMANGTSDHPSVFEPLAECIRAAMTAGQLSQADVARASGLSPQHVTQLVNRRARYSSKPPSAETQEALSLVPGLSIGVVQQAVARSMGMSIRDDRPETSQLRQSAHNMVDQIPESELQKVVQILAALI